MVEVIHIAQEFARKLLARDELARSQGARSAVYDVWGTMHAELDDDFVLKTDPRAACTHLAKRHMRLGAHRTLGALARPPQFG